MNDKKRPPIVGIVGVCASGKSTLVKRLKNLELDCHHIAQEHSYVPDMWQRITHPDFLIYLDVSYAMTIKRKNLNWTIQEFEEQLYRLRNARENADLFIETDALSAIGVYQAVLKALRQAGFLSDENSSTD